MRQRETVEIPEATLRELRDQMRAPPMRATDPARRLGPLVGKLLWGYAAFAVGDVLALGAAVSPLMNEANARRGIVALATVIPFTACASGVALWLRRCAFRMAEAPGDTRATIRRRAGALTKLLPLAALALQCACAYWTSRVGGHDDFVFGTIFAFSMFASTGLMQRLDLLRCENLIRSWRSARRLRRAWVLTAIVIGVLVPSTASPDLVVRRAVIVAALLVNFAVECLAPTFLKAVAGAREFLK